VRSGSIAFERAPSRFAGAVNDSAIYSDEPEFSAILSDAGTRRSQTSAADDQSVNHKDDN
jgi:hypothetical protein